LPPYSVVVYVDDLRNMKSQGQKGDLTFFLGLSRRDISLSWFRSELVDSQILGVL
jgi:hypothetical protein